MSDQQLEVDVVIDDRLPRAANYLLIADSVSDAERSIADALLRCVARWGIAKTTIEDIAREGGVSRATVYRHFPGGKLAILVTAWALDMSHLVELINTRVANVATLEDALVHGIHTAAVHLGDHPSLQFMRNHEPAEFEQLITFERMDIMLINTGDVMGPVLERFLPRAQARDTAMWCARILVSYLSNPADYADVSSLDGVRRLVEMFVLPAIVRIDLSHTTAPEPAISQN